jgi:cation diffusion facilitator family transporter
MRLVPQYEFSEDQHRSLKRARLFEYLTIIYLITVIALMYAVMGSSQALKTAWIEDCLSLVPPICFLVGTHICWRKPNQHYPYGFHRVISILFLCAALALLTMGLYLLFDALIKLFQQEHPTIGKMMFFGHDLWLGWWMIMVLMWGTFPPVLLGRVKLKYGERLNDKILITDGKMNKADWLTGISAMAGVVGIGFGWWWADGVAAALISFDILKDGWRQTRDAVTSLINRAPTSINGGYLQLPEQARQRLLKNGWVVQAEVRLYEHGHIIFGEGFVSSVDDKSVSPRQVNDAVNEVIALDWRLQTLSLMVVPADKWREDESNID